MADKFAVYFSFNAVVLVARILALRRLKPEKALLNQVLHHEETAIYHLVQLTPGKSYELRVSYASTTPTDFNIHLISKDALGRLTRQLLNVDKMVFENPLAVTEQFANVTAIRTGVPMEPASIAEPVIYNIVLEELLLGVPCHVWRLAFLVVVIICLTVKYLVPRALRFMEQNVIKEHEKR
ncbi:uncharacterized protein [Montipora foliosa]|uniref:uncharacterized protein isoform X1 n=1 Tax=Montipora foliosa TaxID=591990 RepID=UPI0035F10C53